MDAKVVLSILETRINIAEKENNPTETSFLYALHKLLTEKENKE